MNPRLLRQNFPPHIFDIETWRDKQGALLAAVQMETAVLNVLLFLIIARLASEGKAIIVISSEMPELLGITDRIYVMNEGRIVGEMAAAEASQEKIMRAIVRGEGKAAS